MSVGVVVYALLGVANFTLLLAADGYEQPTFGSAMRGQSVSIEAYQSAPAQRATSSGGKTSSTDAKPAAATPSGRGAPADSNTRQWRATPELCQFAQFPGAAPVLRAECDSESQQRVRAHLECDAGQEVQGALFEQRRSGDSWTMPRVVEEESCLDPSQPGQNPEAQEEQRAEVDIPAAAARAFHSMTIEPSILEVQPPNGWTLVNLDTIAYAEDEPRVLDTNLFGIPVTIRAVPDNYTWDWGDGASDTGTDPGAPYPNHTIAHAYSTPGSATITLTTTWRGQFRLPGDATWRNVPGQATTSSQSPPLEIREARTRLVEDLSY
jgi:hypothetical protein